MKTVLIHALLVGAGGFAGSLMRFGLSGLVHRRFPLATFPVGTLSVNLLGCLLIGVAVGLMESREVFRPEFRVFVLIGVLGGFTTFSTFGYETFSMLRDSQWFAAVVNVGLQVTAGLLLVWAGYALTVWIMSR